MIHPITNPNVWAEKYSLQIKTGECKKCGKLLTTNIPFATGDWRGLTSAPHECGEEYDLVVATKSSHEGRQKLQKTFRALKAKLT